MLEALDQARGSVGNAPVRWFGTSVAIAAVLLSSFSWAAGVAHAQIANVSKDRLISVLTLYCSKKGMTVDILNDYTMKCSTSAGGGTGNRMIAGLLVGGHDGEIRDTLTFTLVQVDQDVEVQLVETLEAEYHGGRKVVPLDSPKSIAQAQAVLDELRTASLGPR